MRERLICLRKEAEDSEMFTQRDLLIYMSLTLDMAERLATIGSGEGHRKNKMDIFVKE